LRAFREAFVESILFADDVRRWERFFAYSNFARQKTASRFPLWFARLAEPYDAA